MALTIKDFERSRSIREQIILRSLLDEPERNPESPGTREVVFYSCVLDYKKSPNKSKLINIDKTFMMPFKGGNWPNPFRLNVDRTSSAYLAYRQQFDVYLQLRQKAQGARKAGGRKKLWSKLTAWKRVPPANIFDFVVNNLSDTLNDVVGWYEPAEDNPFEDNPVAWRSKVTDGTEKWFIDLQKWLKYAGRAGHTAVVFNLRSLGLAF